ncbi:MAG: relaxase domain-containing protein [Verrucomicrobiales bacterium]|nr:relaxase domain-containing protein [Verrucomicrobiales bacterium]
MLSVSKAIKAGQGEYYLSLAKTDDYYLGGTEPPGFWLSEGAKEIGLSGQVQDEQFRNLLRGFSPDGQRKLVRNADAERRAGWDLTWSVPKSVSVSWSQAEPEMRKKIEACVRRAVSCGVDYLEAVAGISRRGEDGYIHEKAMLIFAAFEHSTSRALDPQLHIHTILLNVGVRFDGSTGTLEPREIYRHQMAAGALFRAELAAELERQLGLRAVREGRAFEIVGVDRGLMEEFSKRRADIEEALRERGLSGGKAAEIAALDTREKKEALSREELFSRWQEVGRAHNWTAKELSFLCHAPFPPRDREKEIQEAANTAVEKLTYSKSHFSARELTQELAQEAQGRGLGARDVLQIRDALLRSPEFVLLGPHRGEQHWTTQEILNLEKAMLRSCALMHARDKAVPRAAEIITEVLLRNTDFSCEQKEALRHVCESSGGVRVVAGLAGTGKSTLFRVAREAWKDQGFSVLGAALSGKAARGLEESTGIRSQTLHRLLYQIEHGAAVLNANTVLVIDEAAMVGTRQLAKLVDRCLKSGATLILTGDAKQLQAIELGGGFSEISRRFGAAELIEIRRQRDEWARVAVKDFSEGDSEKALSAYVERGLVREEAEGRWTAMEKLIAEWSREAPSGDPDTVILAGTNADVSALNRLAQEARKRIGVLGIDRVAVGKEQFFLGDRVLFTRNSMALSVVNGDRGTVRSVAGQRLSIELDSGRIVELDTENYPHLRLGYAMTTHKAQGMTAEKTFVLVSDQMVDREMTYVQASRAKGETRWYVGEELSEVTREMAHSRQKHMAISLAGPGLELTLSR